MIHCCFVLNAQKDLQMEKNSTNKVELMLENAGDNLFKADFRLLGLKPTPKKLDLSYNTEIFQISSASNPSNVRPPGKVSFTNRLPVIITMTLPSDQIEQIPVVLNNKEGEETYVVFNGFWKNPNPKGLVIESMNSSQPVEIQETGVKEGKFELKVKYKLKNESAEEILLRPSLSGKAGNDIRIVAGGEQEYNGTVMVTRPGAGTSGQERISLKFLNTKYTEIEYDSQPVNITWKIVKPVKVFNFPFDWVFLGLLVVILALLVWLFLKSNKKGGGGNVQAVAGLPDNFQKELNASFDQVNKGTKVLEEAIDKVEKKLNKIEDKEGLEGIVQDKVVANNEDLTSVLLNRLKSEKLIKTEEDFERSEVLEKLNEKLKVNDFREAPEALEEIIKTSGGQKIEEILWQRGLRHFEDLFEQLGSALGSNPYYASSRVGQDDFGQLSKIDKVAEYLTQEKYLKLVTKILRITCWKANGVQFKDEALTKFFHDINRKSQLIAYARSLLLDALYLMRFELIIPDIFVDSYTNPDDFVEAPAAPVMQGKWKSLSKELGLAQHAVYDLFAVGIRKEGKVVQKPIVSRVP